MQSEMFYCRQINWARRPDPEGHLILYSALVRTFYESWAISVTVAVIRKHQQLKNGQNFCHRLAFTAIELRLTLRMLIGHSVTIKLFRQNRSSQTYRSYHVVIANPKRHELLAAYCHNDGIPVPKFSR